MKRKLFIFLFFSLLLLSCKERPTIHNAQFHVVVDVPSTVRRDAVLMRGDMLSITDFVDSVSFIRLEAIDESLIGRISQVLFLDDLIIIEDNQTHSVFFFDRCGRFSHKIARRGQGPGEYTNITRAMLDADNRRIMVFDAFSRKMLFYNLDGTFIREINQFSGGAIIYDIINLPNGNFLAYNFDQYLGHQLSGLWEVDSNGVYIRTHLRPNTGYPFILNSFDSYLYHLNDGVGLSAGDVDVIYHFRQDTLTAFLSYTIRNRTSAEDVRRRNMRLRHRYRPGFDTFDHVRKSQTQEKGNWIITEWVDGSEGHMTFVSVYSKRDNKVVGVGVPLFENSPYFASFGGAIIPSNNTASIIVELSSSIVSILLEHYQYMREIDRNKLKELTYGMSEREIEDMNPIIQIFHLRQ